MRGACLHKTLLAMVGPDWYQELSPKQLDTVDDLERCILQDYIAKGSINTKENMAALGLVLRPNQQKLEKALEYCRGDPIEFLLTLYQLSNPKRKEYSINDRLILSAVVHLTMTFTLRELHVRIPSPPRKVKVTEERPKGVKKVKYKSPYLVPYTFKPDPLLIPGTILTSKFSIQRAAQMAQVRENPNVGALMKELGGTEVIEEIQAAQRYYNEIHETNINCILPPTILVPLEKSHKKTFADQSSDLIDDLKEMRLSAPFAKIKGIAFVNAGVAITKLGRVFFLQGSFQSSDPDHPMYVYEEEVTVCACCAKVEDDCCKATEQDIACKPEGAKRKRWRRR
nr:unnamed protein product [Callosobruchus analis]